MSVKRRDSKGRVLRYGESFRSDGRYMYRYTDKNGERRSIYSYRLVKTDKIPEGKRAVYPLRDMEEQIVEDLKDGIDIIRAKNTNLNTMFDNYIELKFELKDSTRSGYIYKWNKYFRDELGNIDVKSLEYRDIKMFYIKLVAEKGMSLNSISCLQLILHQVLELAVRNNLIRVNPSKKVVAEMKKLHNLENPKRHALTEAQQKRFLSFVASSPTYSRWFNLFVVLLGTGGRIGEILGLRWEDCDFDSGIISINHSLYYGSLYGQKMTFAISTPKTKSSSRIVPMFSEVRNALLAERQYQQTFGGNECSIDGYSGFVFCSSQHKMLAYTSVNRTIKAIINTANLDADCEQLPMFSAHSLRHTFCTRLCENEPNIKIIQEIMGHTDIGTTMNVYNEATKDKKVESFSRIDGLIYLGGFDSKFDTNGGSKCEQISQVLR